MIINVTISGLKISTGCAFPIWCSLHELCQRPHCWISIIHIITAFLLLYSWCHRNRGNMLARARCLAKKQASGQNNFILTRFIIIVDFNDSRLEFLHQRVLMYVDRECHVFDLNTQDNIQLYFPHSFTIQEVITQPLNFPEW